MPFPASGVFPLTMVDVFDTTQLALDLDLETHRVALFTNTVNGDLTTDTAYNVAPWNANESTGAGYTAGGTLLLTTTCTHTGGGVMMFDAADTSWATATVSTRGCLIYADALAGNNGICAVNFGADFASTAGTYTITWAAGGIFNVDWIPA